MLNQEKLRVFKKMKPDDFKSVEVYEYIDYSSIENQNHQKTVLKEPTQIYANIRILVACIVLAASLFLVIIFFVLTMSKIISKSIVLSIRKKCLLLYFVYECSFKINHFCHNSR